MYLGDRLGHLAYSTLVHPGDTWPEMRASVENHVLAVKERVAPNDRFGVSLRLSASSAVTLATDADERRRFRAWLDDHDLYVFTVNAFPYGPFKGRVVMADVYEPDWSTEERLRYTCDVADVLAELAPSDVDPSIQTAPLAFRPNVRSPGDVERLTRNVLRAVAHLARLEQETGRRVKLALEPEPFCYLETTDETIRYFQDHLWSGSGTAALAALAGVPASEAVGLVRRHLGVVFDICHQSVEFEDIDQSLESLRDAGVPVFKLQAAAALRVPTVDAATVRALEPFTDTIYLSQTTEARQGELVRWLNLADAISDWRAAPGGQREWRTHFHVPIFLDDLGDFGTTRAGIEAALSTHADRPLSDHVEIETYTWDVLPAALKTGDVTEYVCREIEWLRSTLLQAARAGAATG